MMAALTTAPISRPPVISPPGPLRAGYLLAARRLEPDLWAVPVAALLTCHGIEIAYARPSPGGKYPEARRLSALWATGETGGSKRFGGPLGPAGTPARTDA